MRKPPVEIPFDPQALVSRVQEFAAHTVSGRKIPGVRITDVCVRKIPPLAPRDIQRLRVRLGVSQAAFAALLNVPRQTAVSWESGSRKPTGAALRLLDLVRRRPELLVEG